MVSRDVPIEASTSADRLFQPYTEASMPKGRDVF